jgi:ABC-type phosphate transport system, permease component
MPSLARWNCSPLAGAIGIPVGVLGGVYFAEYGSARINSVLRFLADVLNGIPSITWGVVVYGLVVLRFKSFSVLAGSLALALIMIPLILRTTEEVVLLFPMVIAKLRSPSVSAGGKQSSTL